MVGVTRYTPDRPPPRTGHTSRDVNANATRPESSGGFLVTPDRHPRKHMSRLGLLACVVLVAGACGGATPSSAPAASSSPTNSVARLTPAIPEPDESGSPATATPPIPSQAPPTAGGEGPVGSSGSPVPVMPDLLTGAVRLQLDTLLEADAGVDTPCDAEGAARSTGDAGASSYTIANRTGETYRVYWLDYDGRRQPWFELTPGASSTQRTYESHAWLVADARDRCLGIFHAPADLEIEPTSPQPSTGPIFPTAAPSTRPGSATDESAARATLLTRADLPAGAESDGPRGFREDTSSFASNGGIRGLGQVWTVTDEITDVFDERWQFQTAEGARAFLRAVQRELALEDQGLRRASGMEPVGPNGSVYTARLETTGGVIRSFHNFLMQDGNFVARVIVVGSADVDVDPVVAIGRAAAGRLQAVTGSDDSGAFPNAAEATLLGHVPGSIRTTCSRDPSTFTFATASVICTPTSGATVVRYLAVRDGSTLAELYAERVRTYGGGSTGSSCREGPANTPWSVNGEQLGDVFCYERDGAAWIEWTDEALGIYTLAFRSDLAWPDLYEWWGSEAGPL